LAHHPDTQVERFPEVSGGPAGAGCGDTSLQRRRDALVDELKQLEKDLVRVEASVGTNLVNVEPAVTPEQPAQPAPRRTMVIGMLLGLLASAVLVWWRTRGQGPTSSSSATEQGPEMPRA
jgi:hypothetical protein